MRTKTFYGLGIFVVLFLVSFAGNVFAQEGNTTITDTNWKEEFKSDKDAIKEQKQEIGQNVQQAREEERSLLQQIEEARQSGDIQKAKDLRDQLHILHQQNMFERQEDRKDLKDARQEGVLPPPGVNPPGYNPPGVGPGNPPGYNPPGVGVPPVPPAVAHEVRQDTKEIRHERREIAQDTKEIKSDRKDLREAVKSGDKVAVRDARKDLKGDLKERNADKRDLHKDVRERRQDVRRAVRRR
ncbi:MAG: hypothetical protein AUJ74_01630 [Candidatus Omnitrophica bacterium CG1_02_44_16]|nr:MAG: hypothetical protein AUJ74_01630 [Candidatus Omnitrophica bacterium CG1_02_44_16]PIY82028.1 MAG: hypothetical protein COY78_08875 [Candidatus Omnitrophica bacterium CG_4_10_14_0_8_um_filter_44_12]PIZ84641.1 MAG: hypothetical protein COX96_02870 [Candidatus Omnitrophica bacterium CG_4_10_14_0_2_um_filter_44_9]